MIPPIPMGRKPIRSLSLPKLRPALAFAFLGPATLKAGSLPCEFVRVPISDSNREVQILSVTSASRPTVPTRAEQRWFKGLPERFGCKFLAGLDAGK